MADACNRRPNRRHPCRDCRRRSNPPARRNTGLRSILRRHSIDPRSTSPQRGNKRRCSSEATDSIRLHSNRQQSGSRTDCHSIFPLPSDSSPGRSSCSPAGSIARPGSNPSPAGSIFGPCSTSTPIRNIADCSTLARDDSTGAHNNSGDTDNKGAYTTRNPTTRTRRPDNPRRWYPDPGPQEW